LVENLRIDQKSDIASNLYQLILQLSRKVQSKRITWYNIIEIDKENKRDEENLIKTKPLHNLRNGKSKSKTTKSSFFFYIF
jgi:hypothetical protein